MKAIKEKLLVPLALVLLVLSGCSGDDGKDGAPGATVGILPASSAKSLDVKIESVEINSAPVVTFTATDAGTPVAGLTTGNVSFTIAKLIPGDMGGPSAWQNYINQMEGSKLQGTRESDGTLEDLGNGQYKYTFATDITDSAAVVCDADHDCSYQPSLTHRVAMQISGFPASNPTFDFRPDGNPISLSREIVKIDNCNSCHNKLALHGGGRVDTKYCVTCHNPGSTDEGSGNTVDFKVMIHKIHRGEELPSVAFGPDLLDGTGDDGTGVYEIFGYRNSKHDYSTVAFPQDIRNCTKCHDGADADTPQGDNWETQLSMQACGSCHDNIDFSKDGSAAGANDPLGHPGGIVSDNSECTTCHASGRVAGSVAESHSLPVNVAATKFKFNILKVCGTDPSVADPNCTGTPVAPTVTISVSDPTGATTHTYGNLYDIAGATNADRDPEFGASASLNVDTAWDSSDYTNDGGSGERPSRANSMNVLTSAVDVGDGTFTLALDTLPGAKITGSGAVAIEGHPRGETVVGSGTFDISVPVRGEVAYFGINGDPLVERRVAVDVAGKCDNCHRQLSLHGDNRADNAQLCVVCHNPRNTDISQRDITVPGVPDLSALDGKKEETIDFKVLIHAIHAGERDDPNTSAVEGHGVREKGIVIYGYGNRAHDFGHVRFPGVLNDCTTCHNSGTYELADKWEAPLQNGILATTVQSAPTATDAGTYATQTADQTDDLFTTPTAAVCTACHDGATAKAHMEAIGGAKFAVDQAAITASYETCSVCHGPGGIADLNVVHEIE
jgi:OmcA/MtrC family decaheme c-type cytochrome